MISENKDKSENGLFKRLCDKSLILSCLAIISSRLISYLKAGVFSLFFSRADATDAALEGGLVARTLKKAKPGNIIFRPIKKFFSTQVEGSRLVALYRKQLKRLAYASSGSVGALFMTFGIYLLMVYLLRYYAFNVENPSASTPIIGAAMCLVSLPLLFSNKPLVLLLKTSSLLAEIVESGGEIKYDPNIKPKNGYGIAIILGSVLGISSFFFGEIKILVLLFTVIAGLWILYSPETGLFITAAVFPFVPKWLLSAIVSVTLVSYAFKLLRGKRNLHLGVPEIFVFMLGVCFFCSALKGGGENAWLAFCMTAVYLMFSNLIVTPVLLRRCVSALSLGLGLVCLDYTGKLVQGVLDGETFAAVAINNTSVFQSSSAFSSYLLVLLPFVFCKIQLRSNTGRVICYILAQLCIMHAVLNGHTFLAVLTAASLTLFVSVNERRFLEPIILYFGVPVALLYFTNASVAGEALGTRELVSSWLNALSVGSERFLVGCGMSQKSLSLVMNGDSKSMYLQSFIQGGLCQVFLLLMAVFFSAQRLYTSLGSTGTDNRRITAAVGSACVSAIVLSLGNNMWADSSLGLLFWCCLGIGSACYKIRKETEGRTLNEQ